MIMIPLPFVIALIVAALWLREWSTPSHGSRWLLWFLGLFVFQEVLIGVRFGYGVDGLKYIQPVTAAALPPLAYLAFVRPARLQQGAVHLGAVVGVAFLIAFASVGMDLFLALNNLFYAAALVMVGMRGSDALAWVRFGRSTIAMAMLWLVVMVLVVSGATDVLISYDFFRARGTHIGNIVGWASLVGVVLGLGLLLWVRFVTRQPVVQQKDLEHEQQVFKRLQQMMQAERLFIDPDINLSRIARRMVLPVRDVSRAINTQTGLNVSQYVNQLRVSEACRLLKDKDMKVSEVIYAAGYNTKSNFNREFLRVTGQSPTAWRQREKGAP